MKNNRRLTVFALATALLVGLAGFGGARLQAQQANKAEPTAVAVVNVAELIAKAQENIKFQEDLQKRQGELQRESEQKQNKINLLRQDLDVIADAQARAEKERQIIEALSEFQAWQQIQQQYLLRDQRAFLVELYGTIDKTVAVIAQREGYDLVLFDTPTPDFAQLNPDQLIQAIGNRRVIFRTDRVNLTPVVLSQMDLEFNNRGQ